MTRHSAGSRPPLRAAIRPRLRPDLWLPWIVLAIALALTADLWRHDRRNADLVLQSDFDFHVRERLGLIEQRMAAYQQVLHGTHGLFASSASVDREEFRNYVAALRLKESHPGIQGISFVQAVPSARKAQFIAAMRNQGLNDYAIHPDEERSEYAAIAYRVPFTGLTFPPLGFDAYSDPAQRAAMEQARERGDIALSGKVAMPWGEHGKTQTGFMMYLPIFAPRAGSLTGWVSAPIRIDDLVRPPASQEAHELDVEIYDGEDISGATLLFDTDNWPMYLDGVNGRYMSFKRLQMANRVWTVAVRSLPPFEDRLDNSGTVKAWFGAGSSVLLAVVAWLLAGSRLRAVQAARDMNRALIERETRYRQMFEDSASIAFLVDPGNGRIVDANRAAVEYWRYPLQRLRRMRIDDIDLAGGDAQTWMDQVVSGAASRLERRHRLGDGSERDVVLYAGTLDYQKKSLIYSIVHDITARKQAEVALRSSEERYRLIAENTGDVIWMMDAQTLRFTYISPSIERQRGYTPEEIMALHSNVRESEPGAPVAKSMPQMGHRLRQRIEHYLAGDESQRREVKEIDQLHKDGRAIPVEVESTLLCGEDNMPRTVIGVSRDISARRQAQEEQKRFVSMISHEFRTPLATIDGAVQRLQATTAGADAATRNRYDKIQKAADRLTALLDDYLTQERIDTVGQGLHLSQASPLALLRDSAASARALSAEHVIMIEAPDSPETFRCDTDRMRLTLRVLADNAVKYTPPGSLITLQARAAPQGGIEFTVIDNGDGIPENELPHVFDKFFRGRRASQTTGSGLGLHMARSVVEMHGGTLTVRNRLTGGVQFTIWLPPEPGAAIPERNTRS